MAREDVARRAHRGEVEHLYAQKREGLKADLAAKHAVAMEKLRATLTLTSDVAKVRQTAYQRVLASVSPAVGLAGQEGATGGARGPRARRRAADRERMNPHDQRP
jgi:hypothetical protein